MAVVDRFFLLPALIEQDSSCLGHRSGLTAHLGDTGKLDVVKEIEFLVGPSIKQLRCDGLWIGLQFRRAPVMAKACNLLIDHFLGNTSAIGQGGHAGDAGIEIAKIRAPGGFRAVGKL